MSLRAKRISSLSCRFNQPIKPRNAIIPGYPSRIISTSASRELPFSSRFAILPCVYKSRFRHFSYLCPSSMGSMGHSNPTRLSSKEDYATFVSKFDTFLLDCDGSSSLRARLMIGVLWAGDRVLPNVRETLTYLRNQKKQIIFVTNNSMKSRRAYVQKFKKLNIQATEEEIFGSSYAAAIYIARVLKLSKDKKVYILGERGVEEELEAENVSYSGGTDPEDRKEFTEEDYEKIKPDESVGAVLCGLDQHISYKKISKAFTYLRQEPTVEFIATN